MANDHRVELPERIEEFTVQLRPRASESTPQFPSGPTAPAGAPNVLLVMLDDVGFGAASTFGGPVSTPTLEALARAHAARSGHTDC